MKYIKVDEKTFNELAGEQNKTEEATTKREYDNKLMCGDCAYYDADYPYMICNYDYYHDAGRRVATKGRNEACKMFQKGHWDRINNRPKYEHKGGLINENKI